MQRNDFNVLQQPEATHGVEGEPLFFELMRSGRTTIQILGFMKSQLLPLKIDQIENLLHDLHKAKVKLPLNVEQFLKQLRRELPDQSRVESKKPAMFVYQNLQEAYNGQMQAKASLKLEKPHPLQKLKLQHYREVLKYL